MGMTTLLAKHRKIGFLSFLCMTIGLLASTTFALDPMGPPAAGMDAGQMQVGIDYSNSTMDLELSKGTWIELLDGAFSGAGDAIPFDLKDFEAHRAYAHIGFAATDRLEVFVRVGATEAEFGDSIWLAQEEFESSTDVAVGAGLKATFYDDGALKVGGLIQANWSEYNGTLMGPTLPAPDRVEIDINEFQAALGATYTWTERFAIYGGPFLHFVSGDLDDTFSEIDPISGGLLTSKYSWEIEEDSVFGGYAGVQLDLTENCSFNIEGQITGAADAIGMSLLWRN